MPATQKINEFTPKTKLRLTDNGYVLDGGGTADYTLAFRQAIMEAAEAFSPHKGLLMTWVSTTSFSVGAGVVGDSTGVEGIRLASTLTKTTSVWAAGSAVGGLDAGSIAASTWYYVYVIKALGSENAADTTDVLFSTSATAPTMPSGYTLRRMIGAVKTNGSSQFINFIMYADGAQQWVTLTSDIVDAATLGTSKKTYTMTTSPNVAHDSVLAVSYGSGATTIVDFYGDTNLNDATPSQSTTPLGFGTNLSTTLNNVLRQRVYKTGNNLYARSNVASTNFNATTVWFNIRPYN